jgi:hypothetical protein
MKLDGRRQGHIMISRAFVEDALTPDGWAHMMREVFPVKVWWDDFRNCWHYHCVSRHFHKISEGQIPPTYQPQLIKMITVDGVERHTMLWNRVADISAASKGGDETSPTMVHKDKLTPPREVVGLKAGVKLAPGEDPE